MSFLLGGGVGDHGEEEGIQGIRGGVRTGFKEGAGYIGRQVVRHGMFFLSSKEGVAKGGAGTAGQDGAFGLEPEAEEEGFLPVVQGRGIAAGGKEKVRKTTKRGKAVKKCSGSALSGNGEFLENCKESLEDGIIIGRGSPAKKRTSS